MDWKNMFNDEKVGSPYADMFGTGQAPAPAPKTNMADLFAKEMSAKAPAPTRAVATPVKQNFANLSSAMYSPEEKAIMALDPSANTHKVIEWSKDWDIRFTKLSDANTKVSNSMLDLTQDLAREHSKQSKMFEDIQAQIRIVDELFTPQQKQSGGFISKIFSANEPVRVITDKDINTTIDRVQRQLNTLQVRVDPFVDAQLYEVFGLVEQIRIELQSAVVSLEYIKSRIEEDLYNRRYIRLEALKKIVDLSHMGITRLHSQTMNRVTSLEDFKLQAVPMVLLKLQQFLINKDASQMQGAFDSLLNLRLE